MNNVTEEYGLALARAQNLVARAARVQPEVARDAQNLVRAFTDLGGAWRGMVDFLVLAHGIDDAVAEHVLDLSVDETP